MAVVKEYRAGDTVIRVHDDAVIPGKKDEILEEFARIAVTSLIYAEKNKYCIKKIE